MSFIRKEQKRSTPKRIKLINTQWKKNGRNLYDFAKNVAIPKNMLQTTLIINANLFSMYSFNIHILTAGKSLFYMYDECTAKKGSNEVASFLFHFIWNFLDDEVEEMQVFCDVFFLFLLYFTYCFYHKFVLVDCMYL